MRRPLVGMAIALVLGELSVNTGSSIAVVTWICASIGYVIFCIIQKQKDITIILLPACMGVGILLASQASKIQPLEGYFEQHTEQNSLECEVTGRVYWREWTGEKWKIYIKKEIFRGKRLILYVENQASIPIGTLIQAKGEMNSFGVATNEGQFDARKYYQAKNIDGFVYVSSDILILEKPKFGVLEWFMKIRLALLNSLKNICLEEEFGIFQAVFLGDKTSLNEDVKSLYQANGISHILAISGLHISFLGNLLYKLLRKITSSYVGSFVGGVIVIVAYGWMTGLSVSALRAVIMFVCMMGAQIVGRTYDMLSATAFSAILVLLEYPLQIYEAGFLLTYGAIVGIAGVMPCLQEMLKIETKNGKALLCSFSVQVVTLPILLWYFYTFPLFSILLNLFVIPFSGYLLFSAMAGSIVGLFWCVGGKFFIGSGHYVLQYYNLLCRIIEKIPFSVDVVGRPAFWQICVYYGIVIVFLLCGNFIKEKMRKYIIVIITIVLYILLRPISDEKLQITTLDVGQGDCIYIHMPEGQNMLIDGGSTTVKEVGNYRIVPYLLSQGVGKLEYVVITHPDEDHMNGILELIEDGRIEVKEIIIPQIQDEFQELLELTSKRNIKVKKIKMGDKIGQYWTCIYPMEGLVSNDINAYSVVLELRYGLFSALFTGDASIEQEKLLSSLKPITLLKVGHHGSKYSTGEAFLEQVKPRISIISCGENNFYGHPHKELLNRLEMIDTEILSTINSGSITIKTDGRHCWIEQFRKNRGK